MPNHIINQVHIEASKETLNKIAQLVHGEETVFSLQSICPCPKELCDVNSIGSSSIAQHIAAYMFRKAEDKKAVLNNIVEVPYTYNPIKEKVGVLLLDHLSNDPETGDPVLDDNVSADNAYQYIENIAKHGYPDWYPWCIKHWGTKWDCYEVEGDPEIGYYSFQTAWAMPERAYLKLSAMVPDAVIKVEYADEDLGNNCGRVSYQAGTSNHEEMPLDDRYKFACDLWGYIPEEEDEIEIEETEQ